MHVRFLPVYVVTVCGAHNSEPSLSFESEESMVGHKRAIFDHIMDPL